MLQSLFAFTLVCQIKENFKHGRLSYKGWVFQMFQQTQRVQGLPLQVVLIFLGPEDKYVCHITARYGSIEQLHYHQGRPKASMVSCCWFFFFWGPENKHVCHIIYILVIVLCCNMAVPSKSLWMFYLFCQLFLQTYKV